MTRLRATRWALASAIFASACGSAADPPAAPPAPTPSPAPSTSAVAVPTLTLEGDDLRLNGVRVGSVAELEGAQGYQLVAGLDEALDAELASARGRPPAPRTLRLHLPSELGQQSVVSVLLTAAAAGFDDIVAARGAGDLRFRLFGTPEDEAPEQGPRVLWIRLSEEAVHLTRWPDVEEQTLPNAPKAALQTALQQECATRESSCFDVAIVSQWHGARFGELLEIVQAATEARGASETRPPPTIDFGGIAAGPERDPAAMHKTLLSGNPAYRGCYRAGLAQNPKLAGRLLIRFMVDRDGTVIAARSVDADIEPGPNKPAIPSLDDAAVTNCVVQALRSLKFEAAGLSTGNYPIVFSPPKKSLGP